jgi:hypothetical protein
LGLFDPRPKSSLRDFFDREGELREFVESVKNTPSPWFLVYVGMGRPP